MYPTNVKTMGSQSGQSIWLRKCCRGLKMTNFSRIRIKFKNKINCADVHCVTLIGFQAHRDAFIQKVCSTVCVYTRVLTKYKPKCTGTRSEAARQPCCPFYRPTVLFCPIRLLGLSFPPG